MRAKDSNPPFFQYRKSTLPMEKVSAIIKPLSEQDLKWEEALFSSSEKKDKDVKMNDGCLADIAPTILDICNIEQPKSMTGTSLLMKK